MEGRLPQGLLLKRVFDAIKEMVTDANLECSKSGISLQAMDVSHVSLVMLELKPDAFDHYRCNRDRTLGLNMVQVAKVFKLCGNDDQVIIRADEDSESVTFVFESGNGDRISDFDCKLMQIDTEHLGVPAVDFAATVTMPSKHFVRVIGDFGQFSDTIQIDVSPKSIKFSAKGDLGSGNTLYKPKSGDADKVEIQTETTTKLMFATRYLQYFTKAAPLAESVQLCMSEKQPLEVTYILNDNPHIGYLKFYLAPRMDDSAGMDG